MAVSSLEDDELSKFLASYPTKLHYKKFSFFDKWIFWSQNDEASPLSFPSDDPEIPDPRMIHKKIISALSGSDFLAYCGLIQFWAPVKSNGRRLLTTSLQPFALVGFDSVKEYRLLFLECQKHRLRSLKYQYDIDVNNFEVEKNPKIITGAPARAFLTRVTELVPGLTVPQDFPLVHAASVCGRGATYVMPVFSDPYQSCCIGVFECFISDDCETDFARFHSQLKENGLYPFDAKVHISSKNICGLGDVKYEIDKALQDTLESSHVEFVQVWIVYEDEDYVAFSSALKDTQRKRMLGFKLTSCCTDDASMDYQYYVESCDNSPLANNGIGLAERALRNNEARFCVDFSRDHGEDDECSCFTICLKNSKTRHLLYVLEFFWNNQCSDYIVMLESPFSILKRCLPSFKFASGAQLGDELSVIAIDGFTGSEKGRFRIFEGKRSSLIPNALYEGGRSVVLVEESLNGKWKTAEKELPIEKNKQQFGKTMKEVAQNLNGDELRVIDVDDSTGSGSDCLQTLKGNGSTSTSNALDKGKRSVVLVEKSLNKKCKTTKIEIPPEKMEEQFGKTMEVAKQNLGVSLSTFKRKWTEYVDNARKKDPDFNGDWPGPNYKKRRVKDPDNGHRDTDDENNGATKDTLAINRNKNGLTIKAEYAGDMIKFNFLISSATFGAVEKKIGEEFGLNPGTYKLKYRDQEEDWILLKSDEHMESCIESSGSIIRLRVVDIRP